MESLGLSQVKPTDCVIVVLFFKDENSETARKLPRDRMAAVVLGFELLGSGDKRQKREQLRERNKWTNYAVLRIVAKWNAAVWDSHLLSLFPTRNCEKRMLFFFLLICFWFLSWETGLQITHIKYKLKLKNNQSSSNHF